MADRVPQFCPSPKGHSSFDVSTAFEDLQLFLTDNPANKPMNSEAAKGNCQGIFGDGGRH
jgi:hypothetical protein